MKVIDLFNKKANGEEVPKKIRIAGWCYKFEWVKHDENYYDKNADIDLMSCLSMCEDEFNREVEIIEEDKPIEKITIDLNYANHYSKANVKANGKYLAEKINEIIDRLNNLEKKEGK